MRQFMERICMSTVELSSQRKRLRKTRLNLPEKFISVWGYQLLTTPTTTLSLNDRSFACQLYEVAFASRQLLSSAWMYCTFYITVLVLIRLCFYCQLPGFVVAALLVWRRCIICTSFLKWFASALLPWASERFFPGVPKVLKFYFTNAELRKQPFSAKNLIGKCQISKFKGSRLPPAFPLPTPMVTAWSIDPRICPSGLVGGKSEV